MKVISTRQVAALKRNAMNVYPLVARKEKIAAKIEELQKEFDTLSSVIETTEAGSKFITGGFNSMEVITRVVSDSGKVDKSGAPIKVTKYEPNPSALQQNEDGTYTVVLSFPENEMPCNCVEINEEFHTSEEI